VLRLRSCSPRDETRANQQGETHGFTRIGTLYPGPRAGPSLAASGLAPRERSLVTVSALVASGQVAQVTYHLNRAMDNALSEAEASEALTQLAFYAGWPNVFSAMPVFKDVFAKRPSAARK